MNKNVCINEESYTIPTDGVDELGEGINQFTTVLEQINGFVYIPQFS